MATTSTLRDELAVTGRSLLTATGQILLSANTELLRRVAAMLDDLWPQLLERGLDVVLDFGFWSRESRDAARRRAVEAGGRAVVYLLECDDESTRRRIDQRNEDPGRSFHLSSESIDFLRTRFEPLHRDELPTAIKPPRSP